MAVNRKQRFAAKQRAARVSLQVLRNHLTLLGYFPVDRRVYNGPMIAQKGGHAYGLNVYTYEVIVYAPGHTFSEGGKWPARVELEHIAKRAGLWPG